MAIFVEVNYLYKTLLIDMAKKIIMTEDQYHSLIMEEIGNTVELKYNLHVKQNTIDSLMNEIEVRRETAEKQNTEIKSLSLIIESIREYKKEMESEDMK